LSTSISEDEDSDELDLLRFGDMTLNFGLGDLGDGMVEGNEGIVFIRIKPALDIKEGRT